MPSRELVGSKNSINLACYQFEDLEAWDEFENVSMRFFSPWSVDRKATIRLVLATSIFRRVNVTVISYSSRRILFYVNRDHHCTLLSDGQFCKVNGGNQILVRYIRDSDVTVLRYFPWWVIVLQPWRRFFIFWFKL